MLFSYRLKFHSKSIYSYKNHDFIQKLYFPSITFQYMYTEMTEQSRDHMIPADRNSKIAAHVSCKLKENFFKQ